MSTETPATCSERKKAIPLPKRHCSWAARARMKRGGPAPSTRPTIRSRRCSRRSIKRSTARPTGPFGTVVCRSTSSSAHPKDAAGCATGDGRFSGRRPAAQIGGHAAKQRRQNCRVRACRSGTRRLLGPVGRQGIRRLRFAIQLVCSVSHADGTRRADGRRAGFRPRLHRRGRPGPHVRHARAEAAVSAWLGRWIAAERFRAHRTVRRQRSHGPAHDRAVGRRPLRGERRKTVHHQRGARPHDRPGVSDRRQTGRADRRAAARRRTSTSSFASTACGR